MFYISLFVLVLFSATISLIVVVALLSVAALLFVVAARSPPTIVVSVPTSAAEALPSFATSATFAGAVLFIVVVDFTIAVFSCHIAASAALVVVASIAASTPLSATLFVETSVFTSAAP